VRAPVDAERLERFMRELGRRARGPGKVYLTGGATAVLLGWRASTVDVDIKMDPEPAGAFEAIAKLKNEFDINVELASPDHFLPSMADSDALEGLAGADWIRVGLADARAGRWTAEALAVAVAPTRLRGLGLDLPADLPEQPELALHALLQHEGIEDPYGRNNALLRELDSFMEALEGRAVASERPEAPRGAHPSDGSSPSTSGRCPPRWWTTPRRHRESAAGGSATSEVVGFAHPLQLARGVREAAAVDLPPMTQLACPRAGAIAGHVALFALGCIGHAVEPGAGVVAVGVDARAVDVAGADPSLACSKRVAVAHVAVAALDAVDTVVGAAVDEALPPIEIAILFADQQPGLTKHGDVTVTEVAELATGTGSASSIAKRVEEAPHVSVAILSTVPPSDISRLARHQHVALTVTLELRRHAALRVVGAFAREEGRAVGRDALARPNGVLRRRYELIVDPPRGQGEKRAVPAHAASDYQGLQVDLTHLGTGASVHCTLARFAGKRGEQPDQEERDENDVRAHAREPNGRPDQGHATTKHWLRSAQLGSGDRAAYSLVYEMCAARRLRPGLRRSRGSGGPARGCGRPGLVGDAGQPGAEHRATDRLGGRV
jgi:hypothetical protein